MSKSACVCESLEGRLCFSGTKPTATFALNGDALTIAGTSGNDNISIRTTRAGIVVRANVVVKTVVDGRFANVPERPKSWKFPAGSVRFIRVDGGSGQDSLSVDVASHATTSARRVEARTVKLQDGNVLPNFATTAEPGTDRGSTDAWLARFIRQKKYLRGKHPQTVFVGDSLMERLPGYDPNNWKRLQRNYGAIDLGFSGDTTSSLLFRLQNGLLHGLKPSLVFLCIGTNNVGLTDNVNQTVAGIMAVARQVRELLPQARVVVSGILPRGDLGDDAFVPQINSKLSDALANEDPPPINPFTFSNAARAFEGANYRPGDFVIHSVHLTQRGYARWARVITQDLAAALAQDLELA